ncbi:acetylornithine deacetylase [Ruegeria sp. SCPT10]|uniref:acetylornithine deacetylase n=1 Tax=Ruegeria sp. SCP10 TaxID=3141377 RepID=UPI0033366569
MTLTLDILDRLVGFDTISAKSNLELIDYVTDYLAERGFSVRRIGDPTGAKAGIYAETGPIGPGVLLSAHTDVVPVEGQPWSHDPFRLTREDDRVYGRGTTDMKGYIASVLSLADRAAHAKLKEPLKIVLSYDEEVGCVGIQQMLDQLTPLIGQPRACFVGEPTEMQVAVGHKGKAALRAVCHGQNGHSALAPQFVNALHLATDFLIELRTIQDDFAFNGARDDAYTIPYTTVHVGKLSGGMALNIVPDRAELTFEYRHLAVDRAEDILDRIQQAADRTARPYHTVWRGARIDVEQYNAYPGLNVSEDDPVVAYAQKLAQRTTTKVAFGTEAGFFEMLGIPTVVCGPGSMEGQGHKPDEYLSLQQLSVCDAMMDRILNDLKA